MCLVVFADQITKYLALAGLEFGKSIPIFEGFFHLTLVYNTGVAFGFFQGKQELLFILITISLVILVVIAHRMHSGKLVAPTSVKIALALILGGAIGNWIDRIRHQAVIDFLDFRVWPVFNLADSAITIGVCLYVLMVLRKKV